jgi:hypothetical protein
VQVVRVPLDGPVPDPRCGYTDAFEVRLAEPDGRTAEAWLRAGLEEAPAVVRWIVLVAQQRVLGLRLDPGSPDRVLGWPVVSATPEEARLEAVGPLVAATIVGRRVDDRSTRLTTSIRYQRAVGRIAWTVVAPVHRAVARLLLARAARRPAPVR